MCLEIYEIDPARFITAPGLVWQTALTITKLKLDLLTVIDVLLMVEKDIRGRTCHSFYREVKAIKEKEKIKLSKILGCQ